MAKSDTNKKLDEERISQRVLYALISIVAMVFIAFYLIGFNLPFAENPSFNAPLLTDVLIIGMCALFIAAVVVTVLSIVKTVKSTSASESIVNGIPVRRLSIAVFGFTLVSLLTTFILGSTQEMMINGIAFNNKFWLRVADMLINSSLILVLVAIGVVSFGATRDYRKRHKEV